MQMGGGARLLHRAQLLICDLKVHGKGTSLIVSTLSRQSAGSELPLAQGGVQEELPGLVMIQDPDTHWLEHRCQRWVSLAGRAGPGPWRWDQLPGWRSRFSRDPPQCPVEGGRGSARAAALGWLPGMWAALKDGEQLQAVGWGPCLLLGPSHRKDNGGAPALSPALTPHTCQGVFTWWLLSACLDFGAFGFFQSSWGPCAPTFPGAPV